MQFSTTLLALTSGLLTVNAQTSAYLAAVASYEQALATDANFLSVFNDLATDDGAISTLEVFASSLASLALAGETPAAGFLDALPTEAASLFGSILTVQESLASQYGISEDVAAITGLVGSTTGPASTTVQSTTSTGSSTPSTGSSTPSTGSSTPSTGITSVTTSTTSSSKGTKSSTSGTGSAATGSGTSSGSGTSTTSGSGAVATGVSKVVGVAAAGLAGFVGVVMAL